jgi:hypothetical protein
LARSGGDRCNEVPSTDSSMVHLPAETERVSYRDLGGLSKSLTDDSSSKLLNLSSSMNTSNIRNYERHASQQVDIPGCIHVLIVLGVISSTMAVIWCG